MDEAPKAPWSPFPLTELSILIAFVLLVAGFFTSGDRRGLLLGAGIVLVTLAAGELALREHFAGFRSHSGLIAGFGAVAAVVPFYFLTTVPAEALLAVALGVFAILFWRLRDSFARRSGGLSWRA